MLLNVVLVQSHVFEKVVSSMFGEFSGKVPSNAAQVVKHFLVDFLKNGKYTGFASCGFAWQALENQQNLRVTLRKSKKI